MIIRVPDNRRFVRAVKVQPTGELTAAHGSGWPTDVKPVGKLRVAFMVTVIFAILTLIAYIGISFSVPVSPALNMKQRLNHGQLRNTKEQTKGPTPVVLVSYMRSGSSLTGEILQQHQDVFYVFEPLRSLAESISRGRPLKYLDGSARDSYGVDKNKTKMAVLEGWLKCRFNKIPIAAFSDIFMQFGEKTKTFKACRTKIGGRSFVSSKMKFYACIEHLRKSCLEAKYRVIKTLRVSIPMLLAMSKRMPKLKIIHLVRDPRSIVASQIPQQQCKTERGGVDGCATRLCSAMIENVRSSTNMTSSRNMLTSSYTRIVASKSNMTSSEAESTQYNVQLVPTKVNITSLLEYNLGLSNNSRVYTVRYEDIVSFPKDTTVSMYDFIGIPYTKKTLGHISNITQGGSTDGCEICQKKWQFGNRAPNATNQIRKWKVRLSGDAVNITQTRCWGVMKVYNYSVS